MKSVTIVSALSDGIQFSHDKEYIGVDRGVEILLAQNITPLFVIGDFDSIHCKDSLKNLDVERLPCIKDDTDTHSAIKWAIKNGYDHIDVYGVTGGRIDHFWAALILLEKYKNVCIRIIDQQNMIKVLLPGQHIIKKSQYQYLSLFTFQKVILSLKGVKYPLDHYELNYDDPLCVSNEIIDNEAVIDIDKEIFIIESKDSQQIY